MRTNISSFTRVNYLSSTAIAVAILAFSIFLLSLVSCSGEIDGDSISLEFATGYASASSIDTATGFSEEDCVVLRCASLEQNEHGIVIQTSKSKSLKATTLVFVNLNQTARPETGYTQIVAAPVNGKEYEYDITQVIYYEVTSSSAESAIRAYGIPYSDWQIGACDSSEKFPCCE